MRFPSGRGGRGLWNRLIIARRNPSLPLHPPIAPLPWEEIKNDRGKDQMRAIDSPRHRYACHPSLRFAHRGGFHFFFSQPSLRRSRRVGDPAKRRPGESALYHDISQQSLFCLILGYYPSVGRELKVTLFYPKNMVYTVNRFL